MGGFFSQGVFVIFLGETTTRPERLNGRPPAALVYGAEATSATASDVRTVEEEARCDKLGCARTQGAAMAC